MIGYIIGKQARKGFLPTADFPGGILKYDGYASSTQIYSENLPDNFDLNYNRVTKDVM